MKQRIIIILREKYHVNKVILSGVRRSFLQDHSSIKEKLKNKSNETKNYLPFFFFLDKTFPHRVCIFKNF